MSSLLSRSFNGNFFSRYLNKNFGEVLPRRIKRLLYVSSAMGLLLRTKNPDMRLVSRINDKLKLAYNASGMLFPIYIGSIIWKNLLSNVIELNIGAVPVSEINVHKLSDMDCWKTGLFLARNTPEWLQYGSNELMASDIHDMLVLLDEAA